MEPEFFDDVEAHLEQEQFRRKVMLFQRCDNVLLQLLTNLEEIDPQRVEEQAIYKACLEAAEVIIGVMAPFWPEKTFDMMQAKLARFAARLPQEPD